MNKALVQERIQSYFDGEISIVELRYWAYDNIPTRLEDEDMPGVDYDPFWSLFGSLCDYDHCRNYLGWSVAKSEAFFRDLITDDFTIETAKAS